MLNRRLIRIKVFQALFGNFKDENPKSSEVFSVTRKSILGIENTYFSVLAFLVEFSHFIKAEHNPKEFKFNATDDDLRIYHLITQNAFVEELMQDYRFSGYLKRPHLEWQQEKEMLFFIYKQIKNHERFQELLQQSPGKQVDLDFAKFIYKYLIKESVEFEQLMEEKNIVWYDEKIPVLKNIETIFSSYEEQGKVVIPELSKNLDEDLEFAEELIEQYTANKAELQQVIDEYTPGWDSERITKIDYILMCMALCEFKYLSFVPVKVSINEYIEIAKMYSTPQSSKFLNGTLDKILKDWQSQGLINKSGRGLIG